VYQCQFIVNPIKNEIRLQVTELKNDFNLRMEYLTALEITGDIKKAEKELENISRDFPDNEILKVYKAEYKFKTKEQLINIWKNGHE